MYEDSSLTERDLFDVTRRNSHPEADLKQLYKEFGGVLIRRSDLGNLLDDQLDIGNIELEFEVEWKAEEDTRSTDNPVPDYYTHRTAQSCKAHCVFVYVDGNRLQGTSRLMDFTQTIM